MNRAKRKRILSQRRYHCHEFYPCGGIACVRLRLILLTLSGHVIGYALTLISHANGYALTQYVTLLTV